MLLRGVVSRFKWLYPGQRAVIQLGKPESECFELRIAIEQTLAGWYRLRMPVSRRMLVRHTVLTASGCSTESVTGNWRGRDIRWSRSLLSGHDS